MSPRPPYRGALIGLGGIGRSGHFPAFQRPDVAARLVLGAGVDAGGVPGLDGVPLLRSLPELASYGPFDFVDICTPTATHLDLVLQSLEAGYHVLCEKPVAVTRADACRIADAARYAGRIVMPCHQYRFNPVWRKIRTWLDARLIGRWHLAEFRVHRATADAGAQQGGVPWRGRRDAGLGGVLLDHGTHYIYQLLDLAGPPHQVRAWTGRLAHADYDVEDSAHVLLDYGDRIATLFLTWADRGRETKVRFVGERGSIDWTGGILTLEHDGMTERTDESAALDKRNYAGWFGELFHAFADALDRGEQARHLDDIAGVAAVLEDAYADGRVPAVAGAA